jgi:hypothetical protein
MWMWSSRCADLNSASFVIGATACGCEEVRACFSHTHGLPKCMMKPQHRLRIGMIFVSKNWRVCASCTAMLVPRTLRVSHMLLYIVT